MTTKELVRAEIERLKHYAEESKMEWVNEGYNQNAFAEDCRISSFDKLLTFLDTLPDEPVMGCKDLTKAAEEYADYNSRMWQEDGDIYYDHSKIQDAFLAGAEWQSKRDQETIETAEDHAFLAGSNWQKEQMMKEAVEGVVMDFSSNQPRPQVDVLLDPHKYHTGDKVKIIIVKEEEQ